MPKRKPEGVGFDVHKAIEVLHRAAVAAGAVPTGDGRAASPALTAAAHLHEFGAPICNKNPCRAAGLCLALHELVQYRAELEQLKPVLDAADLTEEASRWLGSVGFRYANALDALVAYGKKQHAREKKINAAVPIHDHDRICVRPAQVYRLMTAFLVSLNRLDSDLRSTAWSRELQQPLYGKRNAPLLTAVWQHLDWGGFTYEAIFELVPTFKIPGNVKDAVRKRVRPTRDKRVPETPEAKRAREMAARSLLPRDLHPAAPEAPKVERNRRRRHST